MTTTPLCSTTTTKALHANAAKVTPLPPHRSPGMPRNNSHPGNHETQMKKPKVPSNRAKAAAMSAKGPQLLGDLARMSVEKAVVDELLLVCGVIGTSTSTSSSSLLVPVTDCLNWLQDLQRCLRRDEDQYRPISLLLCQWKVVPQKLLPLIVSGRHDVPLLLTVCKILVLLTKPLSEATLAAGRRMIDPRLPGTADAGNNATASASLLQEQVQQRENALQQSDMLMEFKRAIIHHPSHHHHLHHHHHQQQQQPTKKRKGTLSAPDGGLLSILVSLLAEPLSRTGTHRTDADHLTIELILHLLRNLLSAEPLMTSSSSPAQQLHYELVVILQQEMVLDILLVLAADLEQRENMPYNLLLLELIHHLLRPFDPTVVAKSPHHPMTGGPDAPDSRPPPAKENQPHPPGLLHNQLRREKMTRTAPLTSRHSHFGATVVLQPGHSSGAGPPEGGRRAQVVSSNLWEAATGSSNLASLNPSASTLALGTAPRRQNARAEPFVGALTTRQDHSRCLPGGGAGLMYARALQVMDQFCRGLVQDCYGPLMKSLKNEFRRDSVRLEETDRTLFFRLVWFLNQWWRVQRPSSTSSSSSQAIQLPRSTAEGPDGHGALGQLIFTMDVFTFNLVLNATDTYLQHKKYPRLTQAVALFSEMMHLLYLLYESTDETEHLMAMGLMDRLYYGSDPVDRLPRLLSSWKPGFFTREYACDLIELVYLTLKLLEKHAQACEDAAVGMAPGRRRGQKRVDAQQPPTDTIAKMKSVAAQFDVSAYVGKRLISHHTLTLYTHLLGKYALNSAQVNHRIVAFLTRVSKFTLAVLESDPAKDLELPQNPLASQRVTLEPLLYNLPLLMILTTILNDASIRSDPDYALVLSFGSKMMHNFAVMAQSNPLLYVEAMFRQSVPPYRFCNMITHHYVDDELRMIAEREMLLQDPGDLSEPETDPLEGSTDMAVLSNSPRVGQEKSIGEEQQNREERGTRNLSGLAPSGRTASTGAKGNASETKQQDESSDEELEFEDFGITGTSKSAAASGKRSASAPDDDEMPSRPTGRLLKRLRRQRRQVFDSDDDEANSKGSDNGEDVMDSSDMASKTREKPSNRVVAESSARRRKNASKLVFEDDSDEEQHNEASTAKDASNGEEP